MNRKTPGTPAKSKTFNRQTDVMIGLTFDLPKSPKWPLKEFPGAMADQLDNACKANKFATVDGTGIPLGPMRLFADALPDQGSHTLLYAFRLDPATPEFANKFLEVIDKVMREVCNTAGARPQGPTFKSALFARAKNKSRRSDLPHAGDAVPEEHFKLKEGDRFRWTNPEMQNKHPNPEVIEISGEQAICKDQHGREFRCGR